MEKTFYSCHHRSKICHCNDACFRNSKETVRMIKLGNVPKIIAAVQHTDLCFSFFFEVNPENFAFDFEIF